MTPEAFWTNLEKNLGTHTMSTLEAAANIGRTTLFQARKRGNIPNLNVMLPVCRALGIEAAILLGEDTPPELLAKPSDPTVRRIGLANLVGSHLNPRRTFDEASLAELADSIASQGLLQNLVVRQDADQRALYWVVAGERRYRALEILRVAGRLPTDLANFGIPCKLVEATDQEHIVLALLENLQRQDVNPMEEAEALANLHRLDPKKWSTKAIAERLGVTQRQVQYRIGLAEKLPDDAKQALRDGTITVSQAKLVAAAPAEEQGDLLTDAIEGAQIDDLVHTAVQNMLPIGVAIFDVKKSKLETWTDPNDETAIYFVDRKAALARQEQVVQAKAKQFTADGAEFVEIVGWYQESAFKEGGTGVVIIFRTYDGEVTIHEGLKRVSPKNSAPSLKSEFQIRNEAELKYREDRTAAAEPFFQKIAEQISFEEVLRIVVWNEIADVQCAVSRNMNAPMGKLLKNLARSINVAEVKATDEKRLSAAWKDLAAVKDGTIRNAVVELIGESLSMPYRTALPVATRELAAAMHIEVPAILVHTEKQQAECIEAIAAKMAGQTDLEDAIAEAAP